MAYKIINDDYDRCRTWMAENGQGDCSDMMVLIGLETHGEITAVFAYNCFYGKTCQQHVAIKKGAYIPRRFVHYVYYYPFETVNAHTLIAVLQENNADIVKLAKHAGFEEVYRIDGGFEDCDLIILTLKKSDCRFLNYKV